MFCRSRLVALTVLVLLCGACSTTADDGGDPSEADASPGRTTGDVPGPPGPPDPADGIEVRGAAYRLVLPADPPYALFDEYVRAEDGQHGRRWRWSPTGEAPFCYVHAVEQPNYTAEFPQTAIDTFEAGKGPDDTVLRNEVLDPPPSGADAAVAQEMSSDLALQDGTPVVVRGVIREQLTPGRTLLQLITSAPEDLLQQCALEDIADSFVPTGAEAPTDPPQPSFTPSASPSGSGA